MKKISYLIIFTILNMILIQGFLYSQSGWFIQAAGIAHNLYSVYFVNESTGWVVGSNYFSTIAKTTNGGNTWLSQNSETDTYFRSVHFENTTTGWVAGGRWSQNTANILKTTNGGNNWFVQSTGTSTLYWVDFFNISTGWCAGERGLILKTTNGGINWLSQGTDTAVVWYCVKFIDALTGWSAGFDYSGQIGKVVKTTNGGVNWNLVFSNTGMPLLSIFFTDNLTGWLLGSQIIYKSTNGGINWFSQYGPAGYMAAMYFVNNLTGWVIANSTTSLLKTINGGANWFEQPIPAVYISSVYFVNQLTGWCVGGNADTALILKTTTGGEPIGVKPISSKIPKSYDLSQNFPNPFNPSTKIKFEIPKLSFTKLIVYDVLGRAVTTLVNEQLKPGTYEVDWDASGYTSGVYFYKLESSSFSETKRMLLIK